MQIPGRRRQRFPTGVILVATFLGLAVASPAAAQTAPAAAALDACRALLTSKVYNQAIQRCEQAVRLDPITPDGYFLLGAAHDAFWQQDTTPADVGGEHRRKAVENYKSFLALNRGDTESRRQAKPAALVGLLGIDILQGGKDAAALEYANQLAAEPSHGRREALVLAGVYSRHGRPDLAEKYVKRQFEADPSDAEMCQILARIYNEPVWNGRSRFDDTVGTLELCAAQSPSDPAGYCRVAVFLWDKAYRDADLPDREKLAHVDRGLAHVDRALALKKDFFEAVMYKGLLLRAKARVVSDPALQQRLFDEATALQKRSLALKAAGVPPHASLITGMMPPPPPPPPPPPGPALGSVVGGVRGGVVGGIVGGPPDPPPPPFGAIPVGGQIKEPKKLKDVPPVYPAIAKQARVQGVVILQCTISREGTVSEVKVLRGIPLLDAAAIEAVKQWLYAPTLMNGVPVPVIMTTTVNFSLK